MVIKLARQSSTRGKYFQIFFSSNVNITVDSLKLEEGLFSGHIRQYILHRKANFVFSISPMRMLVNFGKMHKSAVKNKLC